MRDGFASHAGCFLAGTMIGGAIALLTAPHSGERTRRMARRRLEDETDRLVDAAEDLRDKGQEWIDTTKARAGERIRAVRGRKEA
jgi:gas vesicle protein